MLFKTDPDLDVHTAKYSHDVDDGEVMRAAVNVTESIPGVGLIKAAIHGIQILASNDPEEKKKYEFRAQRAAGTQLRCVTTLVGGMGGALAGVIGGPAGIIAGGASGSIVGGQFTDALLPNRRSIVGKVKNDEALSGVTELVLDGVFGAIGPGMIVKNAAKSVGSCQAKAVIEQTCKDVGDDFCNSLRFVFNITSEKMQCHFEKALTENSSTVVNLCKDLASTRTVLEAVDCCLKLFIIVVTSDPCKKVISEVMANSNLARTLVITTFQNLPTSEKVNHIFTIMKFLPCLIDVNIAEQKLRESIEKLILYGTATIEALRLPRKIRFAYIKIIKFFDDMEKLAQKHGFIGRQSTRIIEITVEQDDILELE